MIFPELANGNTCKKHKRAIEKFKYSVDNCIKTITVEFKIYGTDKGVENIHDRNVFQMAYKKKQE